MPTFIMIGSTITAAISFGILRKEALHSRRIVELRDERILQRRFRDALSAGNRIWRVRIAHFAFFRLHGNERGIMESVVAAFHLDDAIAARGSAREAHGMHRAFRSAIAEAHHLHRKAFADFLRQFPFEIVRHAEHRSGAKFFLHRSYNRRMAVPRHQSAKTKIEIDVLVAVNVVDVPALSVANKKRIRIVGAIIAGYAEGQTVRGSLMSIPRARCALFVCLDFLSEVLRA